MTNSAETGSGESQTTHRVPDFFIVGQPKSGTTALYEALRNHPQIFMSPRKEPAFFATDLRQRFQRRRRRPLPKTLDEYLALFAGARPDQRAGEASTMYLWSREAAQGIAAVRPDARIIAILREPAAFLRSLHLQELQSHTETKKDLRTALSLEPVRREGKQIPRSCPRPQALLYSERLEFVEQLRRYHAVFPPEQVLVLIYDDYRADNEAIVREVYRFLEVDDTASVKVTEANPTVRLRSAQLDDLIYAVTVGRGGVSRRFNAAVKRITSRRARHLVLKLAHRNVAFGAPRPPDERLMLELRRRFKGEVAALSDYLDRDLLTLWGYDKLD